MYCSRLVTSGFRRCLAATIMTLLLIGNDHGIADEPERERYSTEPSIATRIGELTDNFNLEQPTLGGKQFWTDLRSQRGWRIQRNAMTDHCRLLDADDHRRAWGTYDECDEKFEQLRRQGQIPPEKARVVIALHGLGRSRASMDGLCEHLESTLDCTTINVSYASTRDTVAHHAIALRRIIEHIGPEVREINFVAHSLGNIVIRHYLADTTNHETGTMGDPRIQRIVMLGPPNNGAALAEKFKGNPLFQVLWGKSGMQLATDFSQLEKRLAIPACEFGIVAGGQGEQGRNPLLDGNDDFIVTVEETRLPGSSAFCVVPVLHSFLMDDERVRNEVTTFFREGRFTQN